MGSAFLRFGSVYAAVASVILILAGCAPATQTADTIRLLTHEEFHLPQDAIDDFTNRTGIEVLVFTEKNTTTMVDLLERTAANPIADVVLGIDSLERRRVTEKKLVEPYRPIAIDRLDPSLLRQDDMVTPVSQLAACLNRSKSQYDAAPRLVDQLPEPGDIPLQAPTKIDDLVDPKHAKTAVIPDPSSSRMGLYFLVAIERLHRENVEGVTPWPQFVEEMLRWGVEIAPSWEEAWFSRFQPSAGSDKPDTRSLTWGSSGMPAVSVRFLPELPEEVDVAVVDSGCVKIVNYAAVVNNTPSRRNAGRLVDTFVEPLFQYGVPDRYGSRPARTDMVRTDAWRQFGVSVTAIPIDEWRIGPLWDVWLMTWKQIVDSVASGEERLPPVVEVTLPSK